MSTNFAFPIVLVLTERVDAAIEACEVDWPGRRTTIIRGEASVFEEDEDDAEGRLLRGAWTRRAIEYDEVIVLLFPTLVNLAECLV